MDNWRVWWSKLYTCIDLQKFDEAVQACHRLIDLQARKGDSSTVASLEEKCLRAIVTGALLEHHKAADGSDPSAIDSTRRTLKRVANLLDRTASVTKSNPWIFDLRAHFNECGGRNDHVVEDLMKEYRLLQRTEGWTLNHEHIREISGVALRIVALLEGQGSEESLIKSKFLLNGLITRLLSGDGKADANKDVLLLLEEQFCRIADKVRDTTS